MAKTKGPNRIDAHVGSRLRMRRIEMGMTQEKLAEAFGLTFQQVQKYEKGMNRMGSSRLQHAADILGVTAPFFFESVVGGPYKPDGSAPSPAYINEFVSSEDGLRLVKAFMRIRPTLQRRIVALVIDIVDEDGNNRPSASDGRQGLRLRE
jgi:transcriptional regulator with XRE-family HTH domain